MKKVLFVACYLVSFFLSQAQIDEFSVYLEPLNISGLPGVQSFAYGTDGDKWLILGGRIDGLHQRQPVNSFNTAGQNTSIWVVDPVNAQYWAAPISSLSVDIQEQLKAANFQFHQDGDFLYLTGGYGYSNTAADHITYDKLLAVNVPATINAIINSNPINTYFRQITDSQFQITGGHLKKINNTYFMVGGQKFTGRYNPMNGPSFVQEYTNQLRKFTLTDDGSSISITHLAAVTDTAAFHRRDYNVVPQIFNGGQEGLTAFSGVFQTSIDLPYLNCVNIDSTAHGIDPTFSQYFNHYHCAFAPIYSQDSKNMYNIFFGGIAQYYDSSGVLVQDNNVPFVNTIACVKRDSNNLMTENKLPVEMPALFGASAEFIRAAQIPHYNNEVIDFKNISSDTTLVGYIYGGIESDDKNVFFSNPATQTRATANIYKVYLTKTDSTVGIFNEFSTNGLDLQVYPNPNDGEFLVKFKLNKTSDVFIQLYSLAGQLILDEQIKDLGAGENHLQFNLADVDKSNCYILKFRTNDTHFYTQKIVIE